MSSTSGGTATDGSGGGNGTPARVTDPGDANPDPNSNSTELLQWIMQHIINDPLQGMGAIRALRAMDVRGWNEFGLLGYQDIDTLGHVAHRAATDNNAEVQEEGARPMVKRKLKMFIAYFKFRSQFTTGFNWKSISLNDFNDFRMKTYYDPSDSTPDEAIRRGDAEIIRNDAINSTNATPGHTSYSGWYDCTYAWSRYNHTTFKYWWYYCHDG